MVLSQKGVASEEKKIQAREIEKVSLRISSSSESDVHKSEENLSSLKNLKSLWKKLQDVKIKVSLF